MRAKIPSSTPTVVNQNSIGFVGLLTVLFIGLKLTGYITWSWFWVLFPICLPFYIIGGIMVGAGIVLGICKGVGWWTK